MQMARKRSKDRVYAEDLRSFCYCMQGARKFSARFNYPWTVFVKEGVLIDELMATGDAMAIKLAKHVMHKRQKELSNE
jgi:hypothetical protein